MIQSDFAKHVVAVLEPDDNVIGIAVGGSWLSNELDEFSDLDLILVTKEKVGNDKDKMIEYAKRLGTLLSAFSGEHVREPRLLICLFDRPLLHVDIKFLTLNEFGSRVETPVLLLDKEKQLQSVIDNTTSAFPYPDYQWIEDRFWTWIHYTLLKIGRGECFEALDAIGFLRSMVLGPLLHIKNGDLPRGVRKLEKTLSDQDLSALKSTVSTLNKRALLAALSACVDMYRQLRRANYGTDVLLQDAAEKSVMQYFETMQLKIADS